MYTPDGHHFGVIARQERGAEEGIGTVSMLITQLVIQELCDNLKNKRNSGDEYGLLIKSDDWTKFAKVNVNVDNS